MKSFNNNKFIKKRCQKIIAIIIKHSLKRKKGKTDSFSCKNFKNLTRQKLRCFNCDHKKSTFLKQHKKVNIGSPKFFISYKTC